MQTVRFLEEALGELERAGLLREPDDGKTRQEVVTAAASLGVTPIDASSNDYLGLAENHVSRETLSAPGAAAARLIHGTRAEHLSLERELADWVRSESALLFPSTFSANLGVVSALGVEGAVVVSDAANHASLIDGARLAKAEICVVPHLDLDAIRTALRARRQARVAWVAIESYFSMDGDGPDLAAVRALCDEYEAGLIVDEAHALGIFGPNGSGRCAEAGIQPDVFVGAFGKAIGSHGGFIGGSKLLRRYLWNRARSFVYSTALSPAHCALTLCQVQRARAAEEARRQLHHNAKTFRALLADAGFELIPGSFGPIVSLKIGDNDRAMAAAQHLRSQGILAQAIRPPTVPKGSARLRFTVKATFTDAEIERLGNAVGAACKES